MTDRVTPQGLEACIAFGAASIAVMDAKRSLDPLVGGPSAAAYEELTQAHDNLRTLFADGDSQAVPGVALSVIVLAERVTTQLD